ncbi:alpha-galactosidase [Butyrivibrio sp. INlla16]|uniref:alpha-galactosidase n=1 Tax=Butyrivibrio sp. INlla16 TaxID=1520807 RepID=UPI0008852028|nr:alpha-galactosidase [Butyrivibrio sp. INlla16]SDB61155.1 alpha-galactosidase [Butyrivibrio sp. INlla16]
MSDKQLKIVSINDMDAVYIVSAKGQVSFSVVPKNYKNPAWEKGGPDPLVQISCLGDSTSLGFAAGMTRHNSGMTMSFKFVSQECAEESDHTKIVTTMTSAEGIKLQHIVIGSKKSRALRVYTKVINDTNEDITLEALSSMCLSGITPYADDEATGRLVLHRFRSRWSAEGRHVQDSIEDLMLEPSWARFGVRCEKFGTTGSMPVRGFFPFAAVEDKEAGVIWGATLACSCSWQIEAVRMDENLSLTCGLADYEFGHWRKIIKSGDTFITPECYLTVSSDNFETVCDRLLDVQKDKLSDEQRVSKLPLVFNEYCTTWGEPSEENIEKILSVIKGRGYDYFVIDAGWYADSVKGWQDNMGDWRVADDLFPGGIKRVVEKINDAGMKAGIWFELEVVGKDSDSVSDEEHLLTRDGKIIISGTRKFWDMRNKWVDDYLTAKVIDFLNENGFKYIKIDYNDTIGIGCDGSDSYGEGLRECIEGTKRFYKKIRENVPGIAIEVCSSGGHRLEPGFMELADYLSFSDAHEEKEIPVIAADLQKLILPSKSQIWSVLRKTDEPKRIAYSICAGMYGVLCISGDVFELSKEQWELTDRGTNFYKKTTPVIAKGVTQMFGPFQKSNRALKDYQASLRYGESGEALAIAHAFEHKDRLLVEIPLKEGYEITEIYESGDHKIRMQDSRLLIEFEENFDAVAVLLKKEK